jgi:propionate CoA-transferase
LVFCCTFRAGDFEVVVDGGKLRVVREGAHAKFVKHVQQVCFHGPSALARGQQVNFITERALFELTPGGLALSELAPGIQVKDLLPLMKFAPLVATPRTMPAECFVNS